MAVLNNLSWYKRDLTVRVWGTFLWLLALPIFLFFLFSICIEIKNGNLSLFENILLLIRGIFFAGLVPLTVGFFFMVLFKVKKDFFMGVFVFMPAFIIFHYVVAAVSAHNIGLPYLGFQIAEILFAYTLIKKYRKNA